ncbi:lipoprotein signal peptidase [Aestuariicella hydrocarbonica]|uniref:Lipoprotein signal peptidase n=1 Tax=Pseudomaricurvus hydrocarbonicus TaxID=1470433 RepID=A0A9E5JUS3_9GAMM|nr:signal peptidase II [Aestuariicella hydrocarbonica]NHO64946.1 lipoprotein signal peptidase [Aestuariicella hydrocarbonica]
MTVNKSVWKWYGLAALIIVLDQLSKNWVSENFTYGVPWVITDFFNFTLLHNKGAAFSFLSDAGGWQRWFFGAVAAVVSCVLVWWMARLDASKRWELMALALVLGGAIGNLYDRAVLGYVVDFIVVHYRDHFWPAFNLADSAICVGAGMLIVDSFRSGKKAVATPEPK